MEQKNTKRKILSYVLAVIIPVVVIIGIIPSAWDYRCRTRVYSDMKAASESIMSANINLIDVTEEYSDDVEDEDGNSTGDTMMIHYGFGASGVVFAKDRNTYYAMTARHVIELFDDEQNVEFRVFTPDDPTYWDVHGANKNIGLEEYYASLPLAVVEYKSDDSDLAILSFQSDAELPVPEISDVMPQKGDRIMLISNPDGEDFRISYGNILSSKLTSINTIDGMTENTVLRDTAYNASGSSGGGVYNEDMELIGIEVAGATDFLGRFRCGVMVPCEQMRECISKWESG